jgi:RNA polymerase sigma-70 factor (ECF subfamily)
MTDPLAVSAQDAPLPTSVGGVGDKSLTSSVLPIGQLSEHALIAAALEGNEHAFEQLFQRHRKQILRLCLEYSAGDRDQAHDLCQETFISAFLHLGRLRDRSRFFFWLAEIAKNKGISFTRKQRTFFRILEEYRSVKDVMSDTGSEWTDAEVRLIEELIASMPNPEIQETIRLFYLEGRKTADIARVQKISQTAVTTRLNRFRGGLRKRLAKEILKRRMSS